MTGPEDSDGPGDWLESQVSMPPTTTPPPGWRRCCMCMRWRPRDELRAIRPLNLACKPCRRIADRLPAVEVDDWLTWPETTRIYALRTKFDIDPGTYERLPPISQTTAGLTGQGVEQTSGAWGYHVPECYWDHYTRKPWAFTVPDPGDEA